MAATATSASFAQLVENTSERRDPPFLVPPTSSSSSSTQLEQHKHSQREIDLSIYQSTHMQSIYISISVHIQNVNIYVHIKKAAGCFQTLACRGRYSQGPSCQIFKVTWEKFYRLVGKSAGWRESVKEAEEVKVGEGKEEEEESESGEEPYTDAATAVKNSISAALQPLEEVNGTVRVPGRGAGPAH